MADKLAPTRRHQYQYQGRIIYEWDQTVTEINIYVTTPSGIRGKDLYCDIKPQHVCFGVKPNPPYIDKDLSRPIKVSESYWTLEDGVLHLNLTKLQTGEPWPSAFEGHDLDPLQQQNEQQRLLLERFQREHAGFDFSGATVSGQVPNPRTFMGGMQQPK